MNKAEIKQIILEEIEAAIDDMGDNIVDDQAKKDLIEPLANILLIPDATPNTKVTGQDDRIAQAMETGDEDELEDLAAGELDRAGLDEMARVSEIWKATPKFKQLIQYFSGESGVEGLTKLMIRISDHLFTAKNVGFKSRSKKPQTMYFVKGRSVKDGVKGTNQVERMRGFAELLLNPEGFTQKDIQNYVGLKNSAQAQSFKAKLYRAKLIDLVQEEDTEDVSESKKKLEFDFSQVETPEKLPIDVDEQDLMDNIKMELKSSADDYKNDNNAKTAQQLKGAINWVDKNELTGKVTIGEIYNFLTKFHKQLPGNDKMFLHEPTILELVEDEFKPYVDTEEEYQKIVSSVKQYLSSKQPQEMSELEKYIKQVIREAKNPLANRMKEIENQGRIAALETKLSAISEFIEETQSRLTRIDEDEEFNEMMDRSKVKEVRKQLKELEKAKLKLEKEMAKIEGKGAKRKEIVDDAVDPEQLQTQAANMKKVATDQEALDAQAKKLGIPTSEEVSLELNESTLRMQKLAGLITENQLKEALANPHKEGYTVEDILNGKHIKNEFEDFTGKFIKGGYAAPKISYGNMDALNDKGGRVEAIGDKITIKAFNGGTASYNASGVIPIVGNWK